ncbi:60S ribosomal protein L23 [Tupaia chinensis]|uniref:Large ribosomal subunit protein uL14 n=1 Tax=Tupaia chinensis TaxID=246437 RepID=L9KR11_TUPCH|nr:60S ribosomal protein L23 [Tupaia chinensis]
MKTQHRHPNTRQGEIDFKMLPSGDLQGCGHTPHSRGVSPSALAGTYIRVMLKRGCGASSRAKFPISLGLPVGAVINCADNTGTKNLLIISGKGMKGQLNRLPAAGAGDMVMARVKKGKPESGLLYPAVIIRQRKSYQRKDSAFLYFEDTAGVRVNNKGEMKGSAITGPVAKECTDL